MFDEDLDLKLDLSYAAGIVDGEGTITLVQHGKSYSFSVVVKVGNTNELLLDWLKLKFGGAIHPQKQSLPSRKPMYNWFLYSNEAAEFVKAIYPYLKLKKVHAELVMEYQFGLAYPKGGYRLTEEDITLRGDIKRQIRELNHRGT